MSPVTSRCALAFCLAVVGACSAHAQSFMDVAGKGPGAVDRLVGEPVSVTGPDTLAAGRVRSSRSYEVPSGVMSVAFCNGAAYAAALTLTAEEGGAAAALARAGFGGPLGRPSEESDADLLVWGDVAGFARVMVHRRGDGWGGVSASKLRQGCRPEEGPSDGGPSN